MRARRHALRLSILLVKELYYVRQQPRSSAFLRVIRGQFSIA